MLIFDIPQNDIDEVFWPVSNASNEILLIVIIDENPIIELLMW